MTNITLFSIPLVLLLRLSRITPMVGIIDSDSLSARFGFWVCELAQLTGQLPTMFQHLISLN